MKAPSRYRLLLLTGALAVAGCLHGPATSSFPPAQTPHGIDAIIEARSDSARHLVSGELLAVRDDGLLVHEGARGIVFVRYDQIHRASFPGKRALSIGAGRAPVDSKRRALRLVSRFPQGLEEPVLGNLLSAYGLKQVRYL